MSAIFYEQSHQLGKELDAIEGQYGLVALARGLSLWWMGVALTVSLLALLALLAAMNRSLRATPAGLAIDGDGEISDDLLSLQQKLSTMYQQIVERESGKAMPWGLAILLLLWKPLVRKAHASIGQARTYVLEHDADCSLPSHQGPFTNAEDLLRSLRS